jgi:ElaB/YqjD/DUF883 family membrane-anchored ribosome-binding protein
MKMDAKSYCENLTVELNGLKAKLYDVIRKTNSLAASNKKKVAPLIRELNALMDDLDHQITILSRECPAEWSAEKSAIEANLSRMKEGWKQVYGVMGEEEYGIGGA